MKNIIRITSIISYFSIILAGQMIGLPFILWLILTVFDFGNIDQLFAILGVIGIALSFTKWKNKISVTIISLILMLSPIISRLMQAPIKMFDYLAFKIPLAVFLITYAIFIIMNIIERKKVV
ncbi:hypothetical protein [Chryseobacterium daecheongense]|uniref:Uncharacterized protein n=1 Tax=Chryseobacterium daecheongense TaxID=192389 RepID=A0A3N0W4S4_9FLAO|nr:hypothetical protein [Chryseobacterium daecheongense]ROI00074.1 hypothetical protein EGI05_04075 [Chryseobacterium daecheongense]TDX94985.1 hypothetical protein BCF50_0757 [Chryseobacterium daecheongense]